MRDNNANGLPDILRDVPAAFSRPRRGRGSGVMHATLPVEKQHDLARLFIDVHNDFADQRSQQPLLGTFIGLRVIPQGLEIARKIFEVIKCANAGGLFAFAFCDDSRFDCSNFFKRGVPPTLKLLRNQAIFRIRGLVLPLCWLGHAGKSMTDEYSQVRDDLKYRKSVAEQVGIGFELSIETDPIVPNVPKSGFAVEVEVAVNCSEVS